MRSRRATNKYQSPKSPTSSITRSITLLLLLFLLGAASTTLSCRVNSFRIGASSTSIGVEQRRRRDKSVVILHSSRRKTRSRGSSGCIALSSVSTPIHANNAESDGNGGNYRLKRTRTAITSTEKKSQLAQLQRRSILSAPLQVAFPLAMWSIAETAEAAPSRSVPPSSLYVLSPLRNSTVIKTPLIDAIQLPAFEEISSELCLLRLLPVKNQFFRELQSTIEGLSTLQLGDSGDAWTKATKSVLRNGIEQLDKKRGLLQPVFNPEEGTLLQISKGERFEVLIETLRTHLVDIAAATQKINATETFLLQKMALLTLSEIGELLVTAFPYQIPSQGLYSYLPRLEGRCRVTFTFSRRKKIIGNVTIVADGYAAPITAGNFVDLCARGFYTGLPVKYNKKRLGSGQEFEVANLPVLGSFNDGFYDPLTAKLRRLPLEIVQISKGISGGGVLADEPILTYSDDFGTSLEATSDAVLAPKANSRPLLTFKIRGLVAMNHPDKNYNGASSEFFALQKNSVMPEKTSLLDGEYAPFGFIIEGSSVFQQLRANDVIEATQVSEFGIQNLVKLRQSSFTEVIQGASSETEES